VDQKRRWKSLSLKVQYLRLELEDRDDYLRKFEEDFNKEVATLEVEDIPGEAHQNLIGPTPANNPPAPLTEVPSLGPTTGPEEMKKLWRAIASVSHPDKTENNPHKTELYKRALGAWNSKSYDELYRIALELGIDPPDYSEESLAILQGIAVDLEKQIEGKQNSILWSWGTGPQERRSIIMDIYLKSRGKKRK